jgi:hypothetical protein
MSLISLVAVPVQAILPATGAVAGTVIGAARPLLGLGALTASLAAFLVVFKPLLRGLLRAALLVVTPRQPSAAQVARRKMRGILMLNAMAREYEASQPSLAAELRLLANRN